MIVLFGPRADAPAPSWEELESVMLAVKLVVHGLVEFIQNFSKKSHDTPQVSPQFHRIYTPCDGILQSIPEGKLLVEPQPGFIGPVA